MRAYEFLIEYNPEDHPTWDFSAKYDSGAYEETCPECHGSGKTDLNSDDVCWRCNGHGTIESKPAQLTSRTVPDLLK